MTSTTASGPAHDDDAHVYDGIVEHDNRLPRWWLMTLWGAIVFAFGYWFVYETFGLLDEPRADFDKVMLARQEEAERQAASKVAVIDDAYLTALAHDAAAVGRGKAVFQSTCLACHADKGQGLVGPNLTDDAWLHGDRPTEILATVESGVLQNGMPAWKAALGDAQVQDVVAFVLSIKGTHVPGKPPQGVVAP